MAQKFYDIIPPKISSGILSESSPETKERKEPFDEKRDYPPRRRKKSPLIIIVLLLVLGTGGFFWASVFAKVRVVIWPKLSAVNFSENISIIPQRDSDFSSKVLKGEVVKHSQSLSEEFPSSGKTIKEGKAGGIIAVYNSYSGSSQALLESTRFVSDEGKLFKSVKREVVPGSRQEGGKLVPGYAEIEVVAAEPGEDYNIDPSTFSIPGFAGTPKYTSFYGRSFSRMTGGFKGQVNQVTKEDLEKAKIVLAEKARERELDFLKETSLSDSVVITETMSSNIVKENYSEKAGAAADSFKVEIEAEFTGLAAEKADIERLLLILIEENLSEQKKIKEGSVKTNYSLESLNAQEQSALLLINISAQVYGSLDIADFKKAIAGMSLREAEVLLGNLEDIAKIEAEAWPFWAKKIPDALERIEISLKLD